MRRAKEGLRRSRVPALISRVERMDEGGATPAHHLSLKSLSLRSHFLVEFAKRVQGRPDFTARERTRACRRRSRDRIRDSPQISGLRNGFELDGGGGMLYRLVYGPRENWLGGTLTIRYRCFTMTVRLKRRHRITKLHDNIGNPPHSLSFSLPRFLLSHVGPAWKDH